MLGYYRIIGITMRKERDTKIVALRIKKPMVERIKTKLAKVKLSRNAWIISLIEKGLK